MLIPNHLADNGDSATSGSGLDELQVHYGVDFPSCRRQDPNYAVDSGWSPAVVIRTVGEALARRVAAAPHDDFVRVGDSPWLSAGELDRRASALACGLQAAGVQPGDRIATILPNRIEVVELLFAIVKVGAVQVPLNYWLKGEFLRHQLADCGARVLVVDQAGMAAAAPLLGSIPVEVVITLDDDQPVRGARVVPYRELAGNGGAFDAYPSGPDTLLSILYTSGTTGLPKGCMLSAGYFSYAGRAYGERGWVIPGDRIFTAWPMFHTSGQLNALMPALFNDASAYFAAEFHASTYVASAREASATTLFGVGFMGQAILAQPPSDADADARFRLAIWIPMPEDRQLAFERRFNTPVLSEGYGQTEIVPVTASAVGGPRKRSTAGEIVPTVEVRIVGQDGRELPAGETGEITARPLDPDAMFLGYWRNAEATVQAWRGLWHHTGDTGYVDADGFITFVDRKKDAVRRRGENVSSFQLELTIAAYPAVSAVAVTGVPSPLGDDDIKASVVLHAGASLDSEEFFQFLKRTVPYYAVPRYVDVRAALPTNAIGRVMKQVLRDEGITDSMTDFETLGYTVPRAERRGSASAPDGQPAP
jgi:crotonobetaine/carnitine-CoA ligase